MKNKLQTHMEILFRIRISDRKEPGGTICIEIQAINLSQANSKRLRRQLLAAHNQFRTYLNMNILSRSTKLVMEKNQRARTSGSIGGVICQVPGKRLLGESEFSGSARLDFIKPLRINPVASAGNWVLMTLLRVAVQHFQNTPASTFLGAVMLLFITSS